MTGALVLTAALGLSACGGSTVTSDEVASATSSSVAPLERSSESAASSTESAPKSESKKSGGVGRDQSAQEVSEIPAAEPELSPKEKDYLKAIKDSGVKVDGVESQLLGTAATVCSNDPVASATSGAVAGQLIQQGRSDKSPEELTRIIEDSARKAYCA
ncbi:hypothetical protein FHE74_09475 [Corynebacterium tapiri]|uniref:Uncharacterized protein n=1 Tax=Corynebacterium tapiri TaxID=1448266 RepID=A0A5C4U397_9CORY|nr:hypothetical protein FHE74_09475 [Corynebacterium tapiri]